MTTGPFTLALWTSGEGPDDARQANDAALMGMLRRRPSLLLGSASLLALSAVAMAVALAA